MPLPPCPHCQSTYVYQDQSLLVCPECAYEWSPQEEAENVFVAKDANGNALAQGDKITLVKDLKVTGTSQVLKVGSKGVIQRIIEGKDHELDCKLAGIGEMLVSAKYVKKA